MSMNQSASGESSASSAVPAPRLSAWRTMLQDNPAPTVGLLLTTIAILFTVAAGLLIGFGFTVYVKYAEVREYAEHQKRQIRSDIDALKQEIAQIGIDVIKY